MNILVGYLQSDGGEAREAALVGALTASGCQAVRVEAARPADRAFKPALDSICGFLGPGDRLLVPDLTHLGSSPARAEAFQRRLEARGARLYVLDVARIEAEPYPSGDPLRPRRGPAEVRADQRRSIDAEAVRALSDHGLGPSQIARRLGVSRMTVWRKLAAP